jgi:predicted phage terminase large subunit-like protein
MPEIKPNPGPQTEALRSRADILIFGGSAGSGKSFTLLMEPLRHLHNSKFGGVIFRRTTKQVRNEGGLWDECVSLYSRLGFQFKSSTLEAIAPSGMRLQFAHLEHEKNVYDWQGSAVPFIGYDELTHFSESQFWYLLSRNRSTSGVPGYVRATCNADADSWVRKLIDWWIGPDGYPIPERSGVLRWFIRVNGELHWADSPEELKQKFGDDQLPKSLTFIPARLEDNPILMEKDPAYKANLDALPLIERMRLKEGNWNVKAQAGMVFKKEWFEIVDAVPAASHSVRYWDRASTEVSPTNPDPDYTCGLKVIRSADGIFYVVDMIHAQMSTHKVEQSIKNTTSQDGISTTQWLEVDPGQAGVFEKNYYAKLLAGYDVRFNRPTKNKQERAKAASSQAEAGNIKILRASWNEKFLSENQVFPDGKHDDIVDCLSGSITVLTQTGVGEFTEEMTESETRPIVSQDSVSVEW